MNQFGDSAPDQIASLGWGELDEDGSEMWHAPPTFRVVNWRTRIEWVCRPKRFLLDRLLRLRPGDSVLDFGCGTGGLLIDLCRLRRSTGVGVDVNPKQIAVAQEQATRLAAPCTFVAFDGHRLPFDDGSFDRACCKDVLGHVPDVAAALRELYRVLRPGARLAVFSESRLESGSRVLMRLQDAGVRLDAFEEFHISLYPRAELLDLFRSAGFRVLASYGAAVHRFWLYPEWFEQPLHDCTSLPVLRFTNRVLTVLKRRLGQPGKAACNLLSVLDALTFGRWAQCAGVYVLARKPR